MSHNTKLDDWDFLAPENLKQPDSASKAKQPPTVRTLSNPFDSIVMIQAFFQYEDIEESQQRSADLVKCQTGTGLLLTPNKVLTSAGLLVCKKTGQSAKYVLLHPSAKQQPSQTESKTVKSKHFHINQDMSFEKEQKKMFNNFAIIFAEESLVDPQNWQPLQFDWSYDEDQDARQDLKVAGYRRNQGNESYQKVLRMLKVQQKKLGVLETKDKLLEGEEGSVVMTAQKSPQKGGGTVYKVVGLLTESQGRSASAIDFGYLVDSKQVLRKELRTLGLEVLLSIPASRAYQDLSKKNQKLEGQLREQKEQNHQKLSAENIDEELAAKNDRIKQLQQQVVVLEQRISELLKNNSQLTQSLQSQAEQAKKQFEEQSRRVQKLSRELQQAVSVLSEEKLRENNKTLRMQKIKEIPKIIGKEMEPIDQNTKQLIQKHQNSTLIRYLNGAKFILLCKHIKELPNLQKIDLGSNQITDAGLKALAENASKMPNLQQIHLSYNQITDVGMKAFAENASKMPNLQIIGLSGNQITDASLKAFAENASKIPNLQTIDLRSNKITDIGMKTFAENASKMGNLRKIDLSSNQITDAGLKALAENASEMPNLKEIDLSWNQITDAGVKALAENTSKIFFYRIMMDLSQNQITQKCRSQFKQHQTKFSVKFLSNCLYN